MQGYRVLTVKQKKNQISQSRVRQQFLTKSQKKLSFLPLMQPWYFCICWTIMICSYGLIDVPISREMHLPTWYRWFQNWVLLFQTLFLVIIFWEQNYSPVLPATHPIITLCMRNCVCTIAINRISLDSRHESIDFIHRAVKNWKNLDNEFKKQ